ncbi:MFS transporter [Novosphingobium sp. AP12]|uniref:MFS transporter n=1 Tax=Novosphingobium sp. AP12 TaxID=1144305 RepID=UPI000271E1DC|nr:MFS transporter [Novosphingobium sp. AP12]EJL35388.1 arabinose efflux permease family protein [Novosphingobium sp. AP12]
MSALPTYTCDSGQATAQQSRAVAHPNWTIAVTMLASSLAFIDGSVTNVALPAIGRELGANAGSLPWIINAYLLPLSALLLVGGAAGDHYGRKRVMIVGIAVFTVASVGCALAPDLAVLLAARALQGMGAAILMPNSLGILGSSFEGEARGRAVGTWAAAGAIASAVGPPLGGWLVDSVGWRVIFYLNLPVAFAAVLAAWRYVDESAEGKEPLDWAGAALATLALGFLTWALTLWSSRHSASPETWTGLGAGCLLLMAFLLIEHRRGERAMMPLALFASRPFVGLTLLTLLLYGALGGLLVLLPYLLIVGGQYSSTQAGLAFLPFSIVLGTVSRLAGRLSERIGPRWPLTIGPIFTGAGFLLLTRADPSASYWTGILPGIAVIALGMAGAVAPLTTAVLSSVDERHAGTASGFNSAIARTGGLVATAVAGAVIATSGTALIGAFHTAAIVAGVLSGASGIIAYLTLDAATPSGPSPA